MTLAIGIWAILQGAAAAYARGADGRPPGWRYMDSSSFILIANCFSIAVLLSRYSPPPLAGLRFSILNSQFSIPRPILLLVFTLWAVACGVAWHCSASRAWRIDIPERHFYHRAQLQNTRAFMATDDIHVFDHKPKPQLLCSRVIRLHPL